MAFKALLNAKARPFPSLCSNFICVYCSTERAPTKKQLRVLSIINQLRAWAHRRSAYAQLSPLYPSLYPYVTHVINYSRPSPAFPYWKRRKAGRGLGTRLGLATQLNYSLFGKNIATSILKVQLLVDKRNMFCVF